MGLDETSRKIEREAKPRCLLGIILLQIIKTTIKNLEKNNIKTFFVDKREDVVPLIERIVEIGSMVAVGGSVTLEQTGVIELLRRGKYNFLDRYTEGLNEEEIKEIYRKSFSVDAYFCSSNAITMDGEIYNVDGNANRIGAIAFGPKNVIIVAGVNKIVKNVDEAVKRVKLIAAPKNCVRLNRKTFCAQKGFCVDLEGGLGTGCDSEDRICSHFLVSSKQSLYGRIKLILVNEDIGY